MPTTTFFLKHMTIKNLPRIVYLNLIQSSPVEFRSIFNFSSILFSVWESKKEHFCVISMTLLPSKHWEPEKKVYKEGREGGNARPAHWAFYFNIKLFEPDVVVGCCVAPFSSSPLNREKVFICCYCVGALVMLLVTSQWQRMKTEMNAKAFAVIGTDDRGK